MPEENPLLDLQRLDSAADQLHARRAGLPERAELEACAAELAALALERSAAAVRQGELGREERRIEIRVADLGAKAHEAETALYSGKTTALRELEALQLELREFQRQRGEQEQQELAVLEEQERVEGEIAALDARRDALQARSAELVAAIAAAEAAIDAELVGLARERASRAPGLPPPLLALYEKLRALPKLAGRVAVRVERENCSGCSVALPTTVVSRIPRDPQGAPVQCPRCGRILLR